MGDVVYVGQSQALHWWPGFLIALALLGFALGGPALSLLLLVLAVLAGVALPWRFAVLTDGIALWFPLGKYRYLAKDQLTVRVGVGPTVLLPRHAVLFGYPLTDGLIERPRADLRAVLTEHGYEVTS
jgi:hypothetical protein